MRNRSVHKSMIISKVIYVEKPISKPIYFKCNEQKLTTKLIPNSFDLYFTDRHTHILSILLFNKDGKKYIKSKKPLHYLIKKIKSTLNLKSPYISTSFGNAFKNKCHLTLSARLSTNTETDNDIFWKTGTLVEFRLLALDQSTEVSQNHLFLGLVMQ